MDYKFKVGDIIKRIWLDPKKDNEPVAVTIYKLVELPDERGIFKYGLYNHLYTGSLRIEGPSTMSTRHPHTLYNFHEELFFEWDNIIKHLNSTLCTRWDIQ